MSPPEQPYLGSIQITFVDEPGSIRISDTITSGTSYPEFLSDVTSLSAEVADKISGLGCQYVSHQGFTLVDGGWWYRFVQPRSSKSTNGDAGSARIEEESWKLLDCVSAYENMIADVTLSVKWKAAEIQIQHDLQKKRDDQNAKRLKITNLNWRKSSDDYQPSSSGDLTPKVAAASLSEVEKLSDPPKPVNELDTVKSTVRNGYDSSISSFEFGGDAGESSNTASDASSGGLAVVEGTSDRHSSQFVYKPPLVVYSPVGPHDRNESELSHTAMKGVVVAPGNLLHEVTEKSKSQSYPYSPLTHQVQIRQQMLHSTQGPNPEAALSGVYVPPMEAPFQSQYEHLRELDQQVGIGEQQKYPQYSGYQQFEGFNDYEAGIYPQEQGQQDSLGSGPRGRGRGRGNPDGRRVRGGHRHLPRERDDGSWYHFPDAPPNANFRAPRNEQPHQYGPKNRSRPPYSRYTPGQRVYPPSQRHRYPVLTRVQREYQPFPQAQTFIPRDAYSGFRESLRMDQTSAQDSRGRNHVDEQTMPPSPIYESFGTSQPVMQARHRDTSMASVDAATRPTTTSLLGKNHPVVTMPPVGTFSPPKRRQNSKKAKKVLDQVQKAEGKAQEGSGSTEEVGEENLGSVASEVSSATSMAGTASPNIGGDKNAKVSTAKPIVGRAKKMAKHPTAALPDSPQNMSADGEEHLHPSSAAAAAAATVAATAEIAYPRRSARMAARRSM